MNRILVLLMCLLSYQASACENEHLHSVMDVHTLPDGIELVLPTVAEGERGKVEFLIQLETDRLIEDLAIELLPNPRVNIVGDEQLIIKNSHSHLVKAHVISGTRGAMRVLIRGNVDGKAFLISRFVMLT